MGALLSSSPSPKPFHVTKDRLLTVVKLLQMKQPLIDQLDEEKDQARMQWIVKHLIQVHTLLEKERPIQLRDEITTH